MARTKQVINLKNSTKYHALFHVLLDIAIITHYTLFPWFFSLQQKFSQTRPLIFGLIDSFFTLLFPCGETLVLFLNDSVFLFSLSFLEKKYNTSKLFSAIAISTTCKNDSLFTKRNCDSRNLSSHWNFKWQRWDRQQSLLSADFPSSPID